MNPLVSICCVTYNHENYIRQCLEGFFIQKTNFPFEIIIHDDASTDYTANIIREYEAKYPDIIRPIYQTENQRAKGFGIVASILFSQTRGKYIAMCEGDDYWTDPNKLQKQVDFMEANPDYSLCYHSFKVQTGDDISPHLFPKTKKDYTGDEMIGTPEGIATATKLYINIYNSTDKLPIEVSADFYLNAYLGTLGNCKFLESVGPSIRRRHQGGVWTSKSDTDKLYGLFNTKIKVYEIFRELKDEPRMILALNGIKDAIHSNIYKVNPNFKKITMDLRGIKIQYKGFEFLFFYYPLILRLKNWKNKIINFLIK